MKVSNALLLLTVIGFVSISCLAFWPTAIANDGNCSVYAYFLTMGDCR